MKWPWIVAAVAALVVLAFSAAVYWPPGDTCSGLPHEPPPSEGPQRTVRWRIINEGASPLFDVCAIWAPDPHGSDEGAVVHFARSISVPGGEERVVEARLPDDTRYGYTVVGGGLLFAGYGMRSVGAQCAGQDLELVFHEGTSSSSDDPTKCGPLSAQAPPPAAPVAGDGPQPAVVTSVVAGLVLLAAALRFRYELAAPLFMTFTRLQRPRILEQTTRSQIHDVLSEEPGLRAMDILRRVDGSWSNISYHVRVLAREGVLRNVAGRYFVSQRHTPNQMLELAYLHAPKMRTLHGAIRARPGISLSEAAAQAGFSVSRASRIIRRLSRAGLVRSERRGREVALFATT